MSACALRPRYEELTQRFVPQEGKVSEVEVQVLDRNDAPVPGARIEIGERNRIKTVTDDRGIFRLPVDKKYSDENGLVVVLLPPGVRGYQLVAPRPRVPPPPDLPPPGAAEADGGVTTM